MTCASVSRLQCFTEGENGEPILWIRFYVDVLDQNSCNYHCENVSCQSVPVACYKMNKDFLNKEEEGCEIMDL